MEGKIHLLKMASGLAQFGNEEVAEKVQRIAQTVYNKKLPPGEDIKEFLNMINLYYYQTNMLSGGNTFRSQFRTFISEWLKIKCRKDASASFENPELSRLTLEELIFVLGWTKRISKNYANRLNNNEGQRQFIYQNKNNHYNNKSGSSLNPDISGLSFDEQIKMLQKKFKGF